MVTQEMEAALCHRSHVSLVLSAAERNSACATAACITCKHEHLASSNARRVLLGDEVDIVPALVQLVEGLV